MFRYRDTMPRTVSSIVALGAEIRAERQSRGLTQAELARRAGVSRAFVIDVERGRRPGAELSRAFAVVRALGLAVALTPDDESNFDDALDQLLGEEP